MKKMCKYIVVGLLACVSLLSCQMEEEVPQILAEVNNEQIEPSYTSVVLTCDLK